MNYLKPELLEQLAAEYVLGTMRGSARRRFERLMMDSYKARNAVWEWEQQINPMVEALPGQAPPRKIWKKIEQRINPQQQKSESTLWFWRSWSAVSAALVIVLAIAITQQALIQPGQPDQIAMFNDEQAKPLWLITTNSRTGKLVVKPINAQAVAVDNQAFELWMLPKQGNPQSMGLMPVSGSAVETVLSPQLLNILQNSDGLAISLEPEGGSPTGLPTGPVVYQAPIVNF